MSAFLILLAFALLAVAYVKIVNKWRAIKNPRLGILDLTAGDASALIAADKSALQDVFPSPEESSRDVPQCDVLFLYANLSEDGRVEGYARGLREIIRDSGAKAVVVASENCQDSCTKAGARKPYGHANIVITFARRGEAFPRFFGELFAKMQKGASMPGAWVQLAPQVPSNEHSDCPSTIFLCEAGHLRFK
jgi:hypothetical protein